MFTQLRSAYILPHLRNYVFATCAKRVLLMKHSHTPDKSNTEEADRTG
jgi:hypothetical protein